MPRHLKDTKLDEIAGVNKAYASKCPLRKGEKGKIDKKIKIFLERFVRFARFISCFSL